MQAKINHLRENFLVPQEWNEIEVFLDQVKIENLDFQMLGFAAQKDEKKFATGSAAACKGFDQALPERAYFEFLERISLVDSKVDEEKTGSEFCYSKSNGVAIHTHLDLAKNAACEELLERDAILRLWYAKQAPLPCVDLPFEIQNAMKGLQSTYEFKLYCFPSALALGAKRFVTASFGFPKIAGANLCYGFGCGATLHESFRKSFRENLQCLAFLWGEGFDEQPTFAPSASYHQAYFATRKGQAELKAWLNSPNLANEKIEAAVPEFHFVDLTPTHLVGKAHVIKAQENTALPLVFGKN